MPTQCRCRDSNLAHLGHEAGVMTTTPTRLTIITVLSSVLQFFVLLKIVKIIVGHEKAKYKINATIILVPVT